MFNPWISIAYNFYFNGLTKASDVIDPLILTVDINLLYSHIYIKNQFLAMNEELRNIAKWINVNKLSLNVEKRAFVTAFFIKEARSITVFTTFNHQQNSSSKDVNGYVLGVILDKYLT